ncbi:MAG: hypothetical protein R6X02_29405 [Enhygromyxa sp.]
MPTLLKALGWLLLVPAGLMALFLPFAIIEGAYDAIPGLILFVGTFGAPGWLLRRAGLTRERESELQARMVAFVRTHDAFSTNELAAHVGKTPGEAQALLDRDIARYHLPLVMHRASGRYLRLDRLSRTAQVAERCQSCGASIGCQIVFEGERLTCPYCASVVVTHAPAQPSWHGHGHSPNPWGHSPNPWGHNPNQWGQ